MNEDHDMEEKLRRFRHRVREETTEKVMDAYRSADFAKGGAPRRNERCALGTGSG